MLLRAALAMHPPMSAAQLAQYDAERRRRNMEAETRARLAQAQTYADEAVVAPQEAQPPTLQQQAQQCRRNMEAETRKKLGDDR